MIMYFSGQCSFILTIFTLFPNPSIAKLPPNHEFLLNDFSEHLNCPYSKKWLKDGPEKAARDLGIISDHEHNDHNANLGRELQQHYLKGSCSYTDHKSVPICFEMRGSDWTQESMISRCKRGDTKGILSIDQGCELPTTIGGWCVVSKTGMSVEATIMNINGSMTCKTLPGVCSGFLKGKFEVASGFECDDGYNSEKEATLKVTGVPLSDQPIDDGICSIGPGAIGGGHQNGYSEGYSAGCPGTPAEGSPYMWPIRWAADYHSKGKSNILFYMSFFLVQNF